MKALEFSPEEWTADELKERQMKVSEMLKRNEPPANYQEAVENDLVESINKQIRKARKDKGVPRKPRQEPVPEPQRAGAITEELVMSIYRMIEEEFSALQDFNEARSRWDAVRQKRKDFVDSLTKG